MDIANLSDTLQLVCEYLRVSEVKAFRSTCRSVRDAVNIPPLLRLALCRYGVNLVPRVDSHVAGKPLENIVADDDQVIKLVRYLVTNMRALKTKYPLRQWLQPSRSNSHDKDLDSIPFVNVLDEALSWSSTDRYNESPKNTLQVSHCKMLHDTLSEQLGRALNDRELQQSELQCGCLMGRPCYWSSSPSEDPAIRQYIRYRCNTYPHIITAFCVTPYQAFFQPLKPTYAPKQVKVRIVSRRSSSDLPPPRGIVPTIPPVADEDLVYESSWFDMVNTFTEQTFHLPLPVVCPPNSFVDLVMQGMFMRQTLTHADDYYCCLSNVTVFGVPLQYFSVTMNLDSSMTLVGCRSSGEGEGEVTEGGEGRGKGEASSESIFRPSLDDSFRGRERWYYSKVMEREVKVMGERILKNLT